MIYPEDSHKGSSHACVRVCRSSPWRRIVYHLGISITVDVGPGGGGNSVDRSMEYGVWTKKISISNYIDFRRDPEGEITKILMIFIRI